MDLIVMEILWLCLENIGSCDHFLLGIEDSLYPIEKASALFSLEVFISFLKYLKKLQDIFILKI